MYGKLLRLRERVYEASCEFWQAQIIYTRAISTGRSPSEVAEAAQSALEATKPYEVALDALLSYLLTAEAAQHRNQEVMHTLRLLALLYSEEKSWSHSVEQS